MKQFEFEILPFNNQLLEKRFHQQIAQKTLIGDFRTPNSQRRILLSESFFFISGFKNRKTVTIDVLRDDETHSVEILKERLQLIINTEYNQFRVGLFCQQD